MPPAAPGATAERTLRACTWRHSRAVSHRTQNLMAPNLTAIAKDFGFSDEERDRKLGGEIALVCLHVLRPPPLSPPTPLLSLSRCMYSRLSLSARSFHSLWPVSLSLSLPLLSPPHPPSPSVSLSLSLPLSPSHVFDTRTVYRGFSSWGHQSLCSQAQILKSPCRSTFTTYSH